MDNKSKYIRELKKWCRKQLKHIKKPRIRKRVMVERMAFSVMMHHMKGSIPTRTRDFRPGGFTSHAKESGNGEFIILKPNIRAHRENPVASTSPTLTMIFMENNRTQKEVDDLARELRILRDMILKGEWIT